VAETSLDEYVKGLRRMLRALGRRAARGDLDALTEMVELRKAIEADITEAVAGLRHYPDCPESWLNIAVALGVSERQAYRRYGHVGGLRQAGGQPANWRTPHYSRDDARSGGAGGAGSATPVA
jgi:hypothetical protein